jgi:hypothetical protein
MYIYDSHSQATNRKEAGFLSCSGHSQRLGPLTLKELETMRRDAMYRLLGVPTTGRGKRLGRGRVWEKLRGE